MTVQDITANGIRHHLRISGATHRLAHTVVFAHALGTDLRLWDEIVSLLPDHLRLIRYDLRGHGGTEAPAAPYAMGQLVHDAEAICDALQVRDAVIVGLSLGGMVAQGLAVKRLDIVRALVLSNTAARIGTAAMWQARIGAVQAGGMAALADAVTARWFPRGGAQAKLWHARLLECPPEGYAGCAAAIAGTDFYTPTASLRLPVLGIAGADDAATPADLVRETTDLVPGSRFAVIRRAGHLACVDQPETYAATLLRFLEEIGHV